MINRFSDLIIKELFAYDTNGCLKLSESYHTEYKLSFNFAGFKNSYIKTFNGLANNKGGYVIFGIEDFTRKLVGLDDSAKDAFAKINRDQIRQNITQRLEPDIRYEYFTHYLDNKIFGLFYIEELINKPCICACNSQPIGEFRKGDIFYKYNEEVRLIEYSELQIILEEKRVREQQKWMELLVKIAAVGAEDILVLNLKNGELINSNENVITIDEQILSKLNYIKEGIFQENEGAPTIKLIGKVLINDEIAQEESKSRALLEKQLIKDFIEEKLSADPFEYVTTSCLLQGALPIYFFIKHLGLSIFIQKFIAINSNKELRIKASYERIKKYLSDNEKTYYYELKENRTDSQKRKNKYKSYFQKESIKELQLSEKEIENALDSIASIDKFELRKHKQFILDYLKKTFNIVYENKAIFNKFRTAIMWIDEALYRDEVTKHKGYIDFSKEPSE